MSASASLAMTQLATLAKEVDDDKVTPGVLGFIVFAAMALAVWALMKSMNRQLGRVEFEETPDETPDPEAKPQDAPAEPGAQRG